MLKKFSMITFAVVFLLMLTLPLVALADGELDAKGIINSRPSGGNIGDWDIGGVIYQADASTVFKEHHGALVVGVCAEVEYQVVGGVNKALKISSAEAQDCTTMPPGEHAQIYGRIDSFPAGLIGNWVVDGVTYTADANAEFEQKHGAFATGQCVDVKYIAASKLILEI